MRSLASGLNPLVRLLEAVAGTNTCSTFCSAIYILLSCKRVAVDASWTANLGAAVDDELFQSDIPRISVGKRHWSDPNYL